MTLEEFLGKLSGVKKRGDRYSALCPAHDDKNTSLSVATGTEGQVLAMCFTGCKLEEITEAMGLKVSDLFEKPSSVAASTLGKIVATYSYHDEQGELLYQVCRLEPKSFRQRRPDASGVGWSWKIGGVRRVLYRLPELLESDPSRLVLLVEGEKDCDLLREKGFVATTWAGGANALTADILEPLRSRRVVALCDNDDPGQLCMAYAWQVLDQKPLVVKFPSDRRGYDTGDFFKDGGTKKGLTDLIRITAARASADSYAMMDYIEGRFRK